MALTGAERQRQHREKRALEIAAMSEIPCACGCGTLIPPINKKGQPATYAHGHNSRGKPNYKRRGQPAWNRGGKAPWAVLAHKGKKKSSEQIAKMVATRREKFGGAWQIKCGWKHTEESRKARTGPLSPHWRGGKPRGYTKGFTHKLRRLIRDRDRNRCRRCGITRQEYGKTLPVHHIDQERGNNDPNNLMTLCGSCHKEVHRAQAPNSA